MAITLTTEERAKVEAARQSPRPNYFNATFAADTPISEDFEAFIILMGDDVKTETLTWIGTAGLLYEGEMARNGLLVEALVSDEEDRAAIADELDGEISDFNSWKEKFGAGDKFNGVGEVGLLIRDLQQTAGPLFNLRDRLAHLEIIHLKVTEQIRQGVSDAQLRELQSWPTPLLAY